MNFKYLPKFCTTSCCDSNALRRKARKEGYRALGSSDAPATGSDVNSRLGTNAPSSSRVPKPLEPGRNLASQKHGDSCRDGLTEVVDLENRKGVIGVLEVYVHGAKELKDICIYQKQDVYATISLTDDPETAVATQIVNGGGKSPIFNEKLQLNVQSVESALRCEIWMFSRIKNYLEDQSLGFVLVPLSHVIGENGKLQKRFTLSSNEFSHSPCGYLYLTISYTGTVPEVLEITRPSSSFVVSTERRSIREEMIRIEFPDPYLVQENERMVAEYHAHLEAQAIIAADAFVPAPAAETNEVAEAPPRVQTPPRSMLVDGSPSVTVATNSAPTCNTSEASTSVNRKLISAEGKGKNVAEASGQAMDTVELVNQNVENVAEDPPRSLNVEVEQNMENEEYYVELYMQGLQEFNVTLENIKLPLDSTAGPNYDPNEKRPEETGQSSKESGSSSKVYYGSRAFY